MPDVSTETESLSNRRKRLSHRLLKRGQNLPFIVLERVLFLATHQVDVELRDSQLCQPLQLFAMRLRGTDYAEAIDHVVGNEFRIAAVDFAMLLIVVSPTSAYVGSQRGGQFFRLVAR